ncbi:MAG: hypothetical protein HC833_19915 [Leptolyngbyaceae cyanobacterium RM1_406_9]|nr:hypothetical protein [Leptolyngbyaceae cyanobacterium RM1_406_9]
MLEDLGCRAIVVGWDMTKDWGTPERRRDAGRPHRTPGKLPKVPVSRQRPLPRQRPPMPKMPAPESSLLRPAARPTPGAQPLAGISPRSPHPISPVDPLPYAQVVPAPPHLPGAEHLEDSRRAGQPGVRLPKLRFPTSLKFWAIALSSR